MHLKILLNLMFAFLMSLTGNGQINIREDFGGNSVCVKWLIVIAPAFNQQSGTRFPGTNTSCPMCDGHKDYIEKDSDCIVSEIFTSPYCISRSDSFCSDLQCYGFNMSQASKYFNYICLLSFSLYILLILLFFSITARLLIPF